MEQQPENYDLGQRFNQLNSRRGRFVRFVARVLHDIGTPRAESNLGVLRCYEQDEARGVDRVEHESSSEDLQQ